MGRTSRRLVGWVWEEFKGLSTAKVILIVTLILVVLGVMERKEIAEIIRSLATK